MPFTPTTWNPADKGAGVTLCDGDLSASSSYFYYAVRSVHGVSDRKFYWEAYDLTGYSMPGIATAAAPVEVLTAEGAYPGANAQGWGYYSYSTGVIYHGGVEVLTGFPTIGSFSVLSFVLDMDLGTLRLWFDGVDAGVVASGLVGPIYAFFGSGASATSTCRMNFGATPFVYAPPAGHNHGLGSGSSASAYRVRVNVKDASNNNVAREVAICRRSPFTLVGTVTTDPVTGNAVLETPTGDEHLAIALPASGENLNALVHDRILPVLEEE